MSDTGRTPSKGMACTDIDLARELSNQDQNNLKAEVEPKLLLTVEEAAQRLSIGRPKMWQLVMRGEVFSVKIGASRRVPTTSLVNYVRRLGGEFVPTAETHDSHDKNGGSGGQHDEKDVTIAGLSYRASGSFGAPGPHEPQARTGHVQDEAERAASAERKEGAL